MSKLNELMQSLCPDGVQYKKIKDIAEVGTGSSNGNEAQDDGDYPFFIRSQTVKHKNEWEYDEEAIIIPGEGGIGEIYHYINGKYAIHQRVYRIHFLDSEVSVKFAFHYFRSCFKEFIMRKAVSATVKSIRKPMIEDFIIPVPPLEVQSEIVRILDNFTELTAVLTTELQKRREQFRHYSTVLFDDAKKSGVYPIEEICHIEKGKTPIQKAVPGEYPMVVTTTERKSCDTYQFDAKAVCIPLVSSRGHGVASLNHVYYQEGRFALGNILCAIIPKNEERVYPKYLYYYFEQTKDYTLVPLMKGGANVSLHMNDIKKVKVPIPSLEEQKLIVDILDRFDTLCNDITTGLPAEIEARRKQYEYYRDRLLSFKEL